MANKQIKLNLILVNLFFVFVSLINAHPAPSLGTCHGLQLKTGYNYLYETTTQLNNNDHLGKEPVGFKFKSHVSFCNIWQDENNFILQIKLSKDRKFTTLKDEASSDASNSKVFNEEPYPLYAHVYEDKNVQKIVNIYSHNQDTTTDINLKRAIVRRLRTKASDLPNVEWINNGQEILERFDSTKDEEHFESMLKPDKSNKYEVKIKLNRDHSFVTELAGWQNISFASRLYKEAHSSYHSTFELNLKGEEKCDAIDLASMSLEQALAKLEDDGKFVKSNGGELSREKQVCHNCKQLSNLIAESKDTLSEKKSASLDSAMSFLTIVERIRSSGPGAGKTEILQALNKAAKDGKVNYKITPETDQYPPELLSSLLDHCAAARTEPALEAALEHLDLPTNNNLDVAERFLVTSSVSCMTLATTNAANSAYQDSSNVASAYIDHTNMDTSHVYFVEKLIQLLKNHKWSSMKLRWATQLAIGNLVKCHNVLLSNEVKSKYSDLKSLSATLDQFALDENLLKKNDLLNEIKKNDERNLINVFSDELNVKVVDYLITEYEKCDDTDCREVILFSLGNTGNLVLVVDELKKVASQTKQRREQVSALKALKECMEFNLKQNPVNQIINTATTTDYDKELIDHLDYNGSGLHVLIYSKIKQLLANVVYNSKSETTSRILSSELIAKYFSDDLQLINSLIKDMRHFNNFELTTLMWTKMQHVLEQRHLSRQRRSVDTRQCDKDHQLKHLTNWVHAPNVLNGSSTLFQRPLGCSSTMNATYGISMELLSAGKLLKETNFDIGLQGLRSAEQSVLGVSIFARGLSSFSSDDSANDDAVEEDTQAGMSLRVLNVQLRPYTFFTGKSELMSHVWSGTGSTPTPIFKGNFLVSDHNQAIGLLNGFVLEERMYGVLSLDVLGQVTVSLWNRNSHSVVTANSALLIRGSHSVTSSQIGEAYIEQRFAFGGSGRIEFVTDTDFYNTPFKMCLQITQPKFNIRHNTRKYEQVNSAKVTRRIHRRNYEIPAKSYPLHKDNNLMCSLMNIEE